MPAPDQALPAGLYHDRHAAGTKSRHEIDLAKWLRNLPDGSVLTACTATVAVGSGLTVDSASFTSDKAHVVLSAGVAGTAYAVDLTVTATGSFTAKRRLNILCVSVVEVGASYIR